MEEGGWSSSDDRKTKSFLSTASPIMLDSKGRFSFKHISPHNFRPLEYSLVIKEGEMLAKSMPLTDLNKGKEVMLASNKLPKSHFPISSYGANDKEASSSRSSFAEILRNDKDFVNNPTFSSKLDNSNVWIKKPHIKITWNENLEEVEDPNVVHLNMENEKANIEVLKKSLVVKILAKNVPFSKCSIELRKQWRKYGDFHLTLLGLDWLLCSFQSLEAMEEVLNGGPWFVGGFVIGLDIWSPNFSPNSLDGVSASIWVRLPHLPLHCWDESNITRIVSRIGTPLLLDGNMFRWGRREFASACIRVKLNSKLPSGVWVEGLHGRFFQKFEFENLSSLCFKCGRIGHIESICPVIEEIPSISNHNNIPYGPWMQVKFKSKKNSMRDYFKSKSSSNPGKSRSFYNKKPVECSQSLIDGNVQNQMVNRSEDAGFNCPNEETANLKEGDEVEVNQNLKIKTTQLDSRNFDFEKKLF
ncbi:hypothetical protein KFK09_001594 [Dendrobium nobile]|uniref:CCHC-type domain-containing protein n=1 Tax=Dendrobium nobile TaxID=94219 RepID=A0A8T3CA07_DENNO|nr:hypothetical protein KFK09_001594 [Dendrobium nobile]